MTTWIWQHPDWPNWQYDLVRLSAPLAKVRYAQGRLLGRMESLGFKMREEAWLQTLTRDVVKSSEIEGERLDIDQVRSSIARRLGLDIGALVPSDRNVDGVVEMMLDATANHDTPLTLARLCSWHGALFPTGRSGLAEIRVAALRDDAKGPMQVVSGPVGREKVHFLAPPAQQLTSEIAAFLHWFEKPGQLDPVLFAGLAHLWFVTLHPFDDGNGRIARAIGDMALARAERTTQRFFSLSAQIRKERADYYAILERTQKEGMDVTGWLGWFITCLQLAIDGADDDLGTVLNKASFWEHHAAKPLTPRQIKVLNRLLDGFTGKLTTSKWAKLAKCSQDTAHRDILTLIEKGVLSKTTSGGRSTSYTLNEGGCR